MILIPIVQTYLKRPSNISSLFDFKHKLSCNYTLNGPSLQIEYNFSSQATNMDDFRILFGTYKRSNTKQHSGILRKIQCDMHAMKRLSPV